MKIVRISAIWCSSCIIMKSRFNDIVKDLDVEVIDLDYDTSDIEKYNIGDTLPVYIKIENDSEIERLVGEHTKEEIKEFLQI